MKSKVRSASLKTCGSSENYFTKLGIGRMLENFHSGNHCFNHSGLVYAKKTISPGALKTLVVTISGDWMHHQIFLLTTLIKKLINPVVCCNENRFLSLTVL